MTQGSAAFLNDKRVFGDLHSVPWDEYRVRISLQIFRNIIYFYSVWAILAGCSSVTTLSPVPSVALKQAL